MAENDFKDTEFVEYIVKTIVTDPDKVQIKRSVDEMGVLLELTVDKSDMAVAIGKEGRTVQAIRTLLRVLGAKNNSRVNLKIVEPEGFEENEKNEDANAEATANDVETNGEPQEEASASEEAQENQQEMTEEEGPLMADLNLDEA